MLRIWSAPDPALAAAGVEGESLVARARLAIVGLVLITPTVKMFQAPDYPVYRWGFMVTLLAAIAALLIWRALRQGWWRPWIGFASSALDVSFVSAALTIFAVVGSPLVALNSTVTFEIYFLAILATSLRYDARICLSVGLLAILQFGALWAWAAATYDLRDPGYAAGVGYYIPINNATRMILMGGAVLLALGLVRRAQRLLFLAARDRLTGLYNRGHFDGALELEVERSQRYQHPLALAVLDVDHFKRINDEFGHPVGDAVLRALAERLTTSLRRTDLAARWGGEEFMLLFPETTVAEAGARIAVLRAELESGPLVLADGRRIGIGFSAGIAGLPDDAGTAEILVARADARLLAAKRAGRGRTLSHDA
jgi:two-component system cell cycle response regulator